MVEVCRSDSLQHCSSETILLQKTKPQVHLENIMNRKIYKYIYTLGFIKNDHYLEDGFM